MNMTKGPARLAFVAALLALLLGPLAFGAHSALAQGPTQAIYYGGGQEAGGTITALIGGVVCDSTEVDNAGEWAIWVDEEDCGGGAVDGATVTFQVNGQAAEQTVTWAASDAQVIALTIAPAMPEATPEAGTPAMPEATPEATPAMPEATPDDGDKDGMMPEPPESVGTAGLATESGSASMFLVLALGALATAGVAGARTVTGRID
jgi:hypothetical protein